jgi:hypothetical protein
MIPALELISKFTLAGITQMSGLQLKIEGPGVTAAGYRILLRCHLDVSGLQRACR